MSSFAQNEDVARAHACLEERIKVLECPRKGRVVNNDLFIAYVKEGRANQTSVDQASELSRKLIFTFDESCFGQTELGDYPDVDSRGLLTRDQVNMAFQV